MSTLTEDPLLPLGLLVGAFLIVAGIGTLATTPWQYHDSQLVTILRIAGTIGMMLVGIGLVYVAWGAEWLASRP